MYFLKFRGLHAFIGKLCSYARNEEKFREFRNACDWKFKVILILVLIFVILAVIVMLVTIVAAQKKKDTCWHHYQEEPDSINEIYYPHDTDCRFYYQCSAHGRVRMKCQPGEKNCTWKLRSSYDHVRKITKLCKHENSNSGMHFDFEENQCGRPDEVSCWSESQKKK